jgi:predicted transcriptional regulator
MELICYLRRNRPTSIRQLAKALNRDYKDVHGDVQALLPIDLVQRTDKALIIAPWDSMVINLTDEEVA